MLKPAIGAACSSCHTPPVDATHPKPVAQCSNCHTQTSWAAVAIDHTRFFALTGPHDVACATCHTKAGDFSQYTCLNCHEHQGDDLIRKHKAEGITNLDNCASCHRNVHGKREEGREGRGDDD